MRSIIRAAAAAFVAVGAFAPGAARAELSDMFSLHGYLESDLRLQIDNYRGDKRGQGYSFELQQNIANLKLEIAPDPNVQALVSTTLWFYGFGTYGTLEDVTRRDKIDPYYVQLDNAYMTVRGFLFPSLDLTVGRTSLTWGAADTFNPTDLISPRDLRDPLNFTMKVPNELMQLEWFISSNVTLTLVWIPLFRPAQLPQSSRYALASTDQAPPLRDREAVQALVDIFQGQREELELRAVRTRIIRPHYDPSNMAGAAKLAWNMSAIDTNISLTYYVGRFSFPQPLAVDVSLLPADPATGRTPVQVDAALYYPRIQAIGFDFAHSASWLFDAGIFGEIAMYIPERVQFALNVPSLPDQPFRSTNLRPVPFVKATLGMDYTWTAWLYTNVQYVYGFLDELNDLAGLRHYLVPAAELRAPSGKYTLRLAAVYTLSDNSAALFPQAWWNVHDMVKLTVGALYYVGDTHPDDPTRYGSWQKFGQKATGRSIAYLKARFTF